MLSWINLSLIEQKSDTGQIMAVCEVILLCVVPKFNLARLK